MGSANIFSLGAENDVMGIQASISCHSPSLLGRSIFPPSAPIFRRHNLKGTNVRSWKCVKKALRAFTLSADKWAVKSLWNGEWHCTTGNIQFSWCRGCPWAPSYPGRWSLQMRVCRAGSEYTREDLRGFQWSHINYLKLLVVFLTLKCFIPFLSRYYVLVRMDNMTMVACINHQGVCVPVSYTRWHAYWYCGTASVSCLWERHTSSAFWTWGRSAVQGHAAIRRSDSASSYCEASVDALRLSRSRSVHVKRKCAVSTVLLNAQLVTHPPVHISYLGSDIPHSVQSEWALPHTDSNSFALASNALAGGDISAPVWTAMVTPATQGHAVPFDGDDISPTHRTPGSMGLDHII